MPQLIVYSFLVYLSIGCQHSNRMDNTHGINQTIASRDTNHIVKVEDITLPVGFKRVFYSNAQFGYYLRSLQFDPDNIVHLYNGQPKNTQNMAYKVLNIDVGHKDLQQCADAVIRLRAEYLFKQKKLTRSVLSLPMVKRFVGMTMRKVCAQHLTEII